MKDWIQLITAENPVEAGFLRGLLESAGIEVQLRNMELWGVAVEIYYAEGARPSIWVRPHDRQRATEVLARRHEPVQASPWNCPGCGERLEGQFTGCWNCGTTDGVQK